MLKEVTNPLNKFQLTRIDYSLQLRIKIYSIRLIIIVSLPFFLFFKIIVILEYQCNIYYFFQLLYPYLLNLIKLNYPTNYN